jgi:hypothetical protein
MGHERLDDDTAEQFVSACRSTVGDQLRSVTYFTGDDFQQLYLRADLTRDADLQSFVDREALGLDADDAYRGSELGNYRYTIRAFEQGFLLRVLGDERGVFVTTDGLTLRDFNEVATALEALLSEMD